MDESVEQDWVDAEYTEISTQLIALEAAGGAAGLRGEPGPEDRALSDDETAGDLSMRLRAIEASADTVRALFAELARARHDETRACAAVDAYVSWSRRLAVWAARALWVAFAAIVLVGPGEWAQWLFVLALAGCGVVGVVRGRRGDRLLDRLSEAVEAHAARREITDCAITLLRDGAPLPRVEVVTTASVAAFP